MREAANEAREPMLNLAGLGADNRNFISLVLAGKSYRALLDTGAVLSIIGPRVVDNVQERLKPSNTIVRTATGKMSRVLGALEVHFEVDATTKKFCFKVVPEL